MRSELTMPIKDAEHHLVRLCDHCQRNHGLDVETVLGRAHIDLADGICVIAASRNSLHVTVKAFDELHLQMVQAFVGRHLQRLVFGRSAVLEWSAATGADGFGASPEAKLRALAATLDQAKAAAERA